MIVSKFRLFKDKLQIFCYLQDYQIKITLINTLKAKDDLLQTTLKGLICWLANSWRSFLISILTEANSFWGQEFEGACESSSSLGVSNPVKLETKYAKI